MPTQSEVASYLNISERTFRRYTAERRARLTKDCAHGVNQDTADLVAHLHREVYKHNEITKRYSFVSMLSGSFTLCIETEILLDMVPINQRNLTTAIKKMREVTYGNL